MKNYLIAVILLIIGVTTGVAQNGTMVLTSPTPNPIPIGESGTGTFTLTLVQPWGPGEVLSFASPSSALSDYPVTSITSASAGFFDAWDFTSDPSNPYTYSNKITPAGTYVFTYVITPTGTITDEIGTGLQVNFGNLIGVASVALPVTLVSFNVAAENNLAQLTWKTSEEVNSDYFEIQHSLNAKDWSTAGSVQSHNNGKQSNTYTFSFTAKDNGVNYFRLKMVDLDTKFAYSGIRSVSFSDINPSEKGQLVVSPNPVSYGNVSIEVKNSSQSNRIELLSLTGKVIAKFNTAGNASIDTSNLPGGMYIVRVLQNDGKVYTKNVVVAK